MSLILITTSAYSYSYYRPGEACVTCHEDYVAPSKPSVTSRTHPDQSKYYRNNDVYLSWYSTDSPSGIRGYRYHLDHIPSTNPNSALYTKNSVTLNNRANGTWYFHLKAMDWSELRNYSKISHYRFYIDTYKPRVSALFPTNSRQGGYAKLYYKVKDPYTNNKAKVTIRIKRGGKTYKIIRLGTKTINQKSYCRYKANLPRGIYFYYVYAQDLAGNSQYKVSSNYLVIW